jgi:DNA-binding response OmpR family regulator
MSGSPFQIVLVEDAELDVFLIRQALEQAGLTFELHLLRDGEKALEFISKIDSDETAPLPSLIILDLNLPRVNGSQVLQRVRESSRWARIPVLVLTSSDSPKDRGVVAQFSATPYLRKSSRLDEFMSLGRVIRDLLERGDSWSRACAQ